MTQQEEQDARNITAYRKPASRLTLPLALAALGSAVLLAGCGGGGGNGNSLGTTGTTGTGTTGTGTGTGGGTPTLAPAIAGLNSLVRGSQAVTVSNLTTVAGQFDQARQADAASKDAQLGYAVTEAALLSAQAANLSGSTPIPAAKSGAILSPAAQTAQFSQALILWRLPQFLSGSAHVQWPQAPQYLPTGILTAQLQPRASAVTPAQVQTELTALDAGLVKVEAALAVVESDPNYTYTLADPSQPGNTAATVKVGSAEFQILSSVVSLIRSVTNAGVAYNADPGTFDFNAAVPGAVLSAASVGPAQYLPAGPFLTLNADGTARMTAVQTELSATATSGIAAIEAVKTRNNAGFLLNPGTLVTTGQLNTAEAQITAYKAYLTGIQTVPVTLNGSTISTRVNLSAFLTHPPADLRALLPTLASSTSSGTTLLTMNGFPDLTFGGIFPDGLPVKPAAFTLPVITGGTSNNLSYSKIIAFALTLQTS